MNIQEIISRMTLREKVAFCTGGDFWHTKALPDLGVPAVMMADGPMVSAARRRARTWWA